MNVLVYMTVTVTEEALLLIPRRKKDTRETVATGWTIRGSNSGGGEIFRTRPVRLWGPPSLL
jgi:hypothetical protein